MQAGRNGLDHRFCDPPKRERQDTDGEKYFAEICRRWRTGGGRAFVSARQPRKKQEGDRENKETKVNAAHQSTVAHYTA